MPADQDRKAAPSHEEYTVLSWSGDIELKDRAGGGEPIFEAKLLRGDGVAVRLVMWVFAATFYEYFRYELSTDLHTGTIHTQSD